MRVCVCSPPSCKLLTTHEMKEGIITVCEGTGHLLQLFFDPEQAPFRIPTSGLLGPQSIQLQVWAMRIVRAGLRRHTTIELNIL